MTSLPELLKPSDIAKALQVSRAQSYALASTMPHVKFSSKRNGRGSIRVRREDFETWLAAQVVAP